MNAHVQGGTDLGQWRIEAFVDAERNKILGYDRRLQLGFIATAEVNERLHVGAGNMVENQGVRDDLGIEDDAVTLLPRWIGYAKFDIYKIDILLMSTPEISFADFQTQIELAYSAPVTDKINVDLGLVIDYDSDPVIKGQEITRTYLAQIGIEF